MGYWEEKAEYDTLQELKEGSQEFSFEKILDIHPKNKTVTFKITKRDHKF